MNEYTPTPEQLDTLGKIADSVEAKAAEMVEQIVAPEPAKAYFPFEYHDVDPATLDQARLLATIDMLDKQRRELQTVNADDWRIEHIWEKAAEIADRKGYCSEFEEMMDELGTGFIRETEYEVKVKVEQYIWVYVTAKRGASDYDIQEMLEENPDLISDALANTSTQVNDLDSWEIDYINTL